MARRTTAQTQAQLPAGIDQATLMAAIQQGQDINQVIEEMRLQQARSKALEGHGLMTVRLNRNMPIKQSTKTGRWYALGQLVSAENVCIQGGRQLTPERLKKIGNIEVDLGFSEGCVAQVEAYRDQVGGNHQFEFILCAQAELTQLKVDVMDESENPEMKFQLRVMCEGFLSAEVSSIPSLDLPESDDELDDLLEKAGQISAKVQAKSLDKWRLDQQAKAVAATEESIADELIAMETKAVEA